MPATGFFLFTDTGGIRKSIYPWIHFETAFLQGFITAQEYDETVVFIG